MSAQAVATTRLHAQDCMGIAAHTLAGIRSGLLSPSALWDMRLAVGAALASPIAIVMAKAVPGAAAPHRPFGPLWNHAVRHLFRKPPRARHAAFAAQRPRRGTTRWIRKRLQAFARKGARA